MYRILRKRGTGKTTNLITLAKETGAWMYLIYKIQGCW